MSVLQRTTPRRAKSQLRVAELLAAARAVFSEHGFQRATTAQIAERAGVSEATVFTYFPGKRELCVQVIKDWYDEISRDLETTLPALDGLPARLAYVVRQHLHTLLADGAGLCALVLGEARTTAPELADVITECKRRYTAPLMDALAQARAQGEIRADVPLRLVRDLVYGTMEHVLWDAVTTGRRPDLEATARDLVALFGGALNPPARHSSAQGTSDAASTAALRRFHTDVVQALRTLEQGSPR